MRRPTDPYPPRACADLKTEPHQGEFDLAIADFTKAIDPDDLDAVTYWPRMA
jgi:hypothetical protein